MRNRAGTTFLELIIVLALLGVLLGIVAPPVAGWRDALAVRAARDELAAALSAARATAAATGGATLLVDGASAVFWVAGEGGAGPATDLGARYGVRLVGADGVVAFHYDALGIGRLASRSLRVQRGRAEAGIVVSAYGRVRRW